MLTFVTLLSPASAGQYSYNFVGALNTIRANPKSGVQFLTQMKKTFEAPENVIFTDLFATRIKTIQGVKKFDDAIAFLNSQKAVGAVTEINCLDKAAQILAAANYKRLQASYKTDKDVYYWDLQDEACNYKWRTHGASYYESKNNFYNSSAAVEDLLLMVVDDGLSTPIDRNTLFDADVKYVGAAKNYTYPVIFLVTANNDFKQSSLKTYSQIVVKKAGTDNPPPPQPQPQPVTPATPKAAIVNFITGVVGRRHHRK